MLDNKLQTFLTLCETQNYSQAAKKLNITQPAVSQHIQYLKNYYGVLLISNKGKNFELTDEGKVLKLPFILETPNELKGHEKEIKLLKELYKDSRKIFRLNLCRFLYLEISCLL